MSKIVHAPDCRGEMFDAYFVNGNFYDKTLVDLGRKRSGKPRETPEEYIRRTEECLSLIHI